jgi:hypothetical protein
MILGLLALGGLLSWAAILRDWKLGLLLLVLFLPFAGAIILLTKGSIMAHLAKDLLFVVPIYLSFLIHGVTRRNLQYPPFLTLALLLLAAIVIASSPIRTWRISQSGWWARRSGCSTFPSCSSPPPP